MIEKAKQKHLDAIMDIWIKTNISAHAFIPCEYWENAYAKVREAMKDAELFVYLKNDAVVGFIGITGEGYIAGLFVDENYRSQGIGRKLLDYCKQNYPRLELSVFAENPKAVNFYLANEFEIVKTVANSDFFDHDEHQMVWSAPNIK